MCTEIYINPHWENGEGDSVIVVQCLKNWVVVVFSFLELSACQAEIGSEIRLKEDSFMCQWWHCRGHIYIMYMYVYICSTAETPCVLDQWIKRSKCAFRATWTFHFSFHPSIHSFIHPSVGQSICLSECMFDQVLTQSSVCLSVCLKVHLSTSSPTCLSVYLSEC